MGDMIKNPDTNDLVELLKSRNVRLYHACQLQDFISYLKLGGVPSRQRLESRGQCFTAFLSDATDKDNDVWDKVFFNLEDFGKYFHKHRSLSTPNVYGPIVLVFEPDILLNATDVSVTLRSAGAKGFSRTAEALPLHDIDKIFSYPSDDKYRANWIKNVGELRKTFTTSKNLKIKSRPELNCTFDNNIFAIGQESFDNVVDILVDPLTFKSKKLIDKVKQAANNYHPNLGDLVQQRFSDNFHIYNLLVKFADVYAGIEPNLKNEGLNIPSPFKEWIQQYSEQDHFYQLHRYLIYLKKGTLAPMELTDEDYHKLLAA